MRNVKSKCEVQKSKFSMIAVLGIIIGMLALIASAPVTVAQPTPFLISGFVAYSDGKPILNPTVTITNTNTTEIFIVETSEDSNYYRLLTDLSSVSAGDVINFYASNEHEKTLNHTVTEEEIATCGFEQDITIMAMPQAIELNISALGAYHNNTGCPPWFNISNEVDVEVNNIGSIDAGAFNVSLYADGEFIGKQKVSSLGAGNSTTVQFKKWKPIGEDCLQEPCEFNWSCRNYSLTGVADCDNDVNEHYEGNNNLTKEERACYNGYMADEPLKNVVHGKIHGGLLFTTGDGKYKKLDNYACSQETHYEITLPESATVKLARLNVYYTWTKPAHACPDIRVAITNETGTYVLPREKAYNDIKCSVPEAAWVLTWGNYVYDLTDYIKGNYNYTVNVKQLCCGSYSVCVAAPGIVVIYEDETRPPIEYWLNEGADILLGGRRGDGGALSLEECINNATFPGSIDLREVKNATLGVVSPWAGHVWKPGMTNYLYFNGIELGRGVYHGYKETYSETIDSLTVEINSTDAQVGVNVTDVTEYLNADDNVAGQGDDGDNMMPTNAFLVLEYSDSDLKVNKTVYDTVKELWVKELNAKLNDTLRFRCVIENAGRYNMTNISVVDMLPHSFEYRGNATVDGTQQEPDWIAGDQFGWNLSGPLTVGETITIEFDAMVVNLGSGTNIIKASAWHDEQWFSVEDYVRVTVPEPLSTPLVVYGWVNHSTGSTLNNPDVAITNLNTTEIFVADTSNYSNYYQVMVRNVSAGDELHFRATDNGGNSTEFSHTLTQEEINIGGLFSFNITLKSRPAIFDTGEGTGPSIFGTHRGTLTPNQTIEVNKLYTYTCTDMAGHSEYVEIYNDSFYMNATWHSDYTGDYHNISFPDQFSLLADHTYNYTIKTGSYPQIHHTDELEVAGGIIRCTEFTDVNGDIHNNRIPAIKLFTEI